MDNELTTHAVATTDTLPVRPWTEVDHRLATLGLVPLLATVVAPAQAADAALGWVPTPPAPVRTDAVAGTTLVPATPAHRWVPQADLRAVAAPDTAAREAVHAALRRIAVPLRELPAERRVSVRAPLPSVRHPAEAASSHPLATPASARRRDHAALERLALRAQVAGQRSMTWVVLLILFLAGGYAASMTVPARDTARLRRADNGDLQWQATGGEWVDATQRPVDRRDVQTSLAWASLAAWAIVGAILIQAGNTTQAFARLSHRLVGSDVAALGERGVRRHRRAMRLWALPGWLAVVIWVHALRTVRLQQLERAFVSRA